MILRWSPSLRIAGESGQLSEFIDGLGPGQLVGRQVLGASSLGDIQLSLCYQKGFLEVEVIRARGLQARPGSKVLPGTDCTSLRSLYRENSDEVAHVAGEAMPGIKLKKVWHSRISSQFSLHVRAVVVRLCLKIPNAQC